jgi:hypothetical protein
MKRAHKRKKQKKVSRNEEISKQSIKDKLKRKRKLQTQCNLMMIKTRWRADLKWNRR